MNTLKNKIDFVVLVSVDRANANGDPLDGNRPRTDYDGYGEMSDVCIKRKIRNRMQDMGEPIFVQSNDRQTDDFSCLAKRAESVLASENSPSDYAKKACQTWLDVRSFGQVFAYNGKKNKKAKGEEGGDGVSVGVRGPVTIHQAVSVSPIDIISLKITKSVNGEDPKSGNGKSSDTMGDKHYVRFGLYKIKGSINVQLAQKTGFTYEDAMVIKEALRTLFEGDASSARPEGSMEILKLFWFEHNCPVGQYSSAKVHRSIQVTQKADVLIPRKVEDYEITIEELPNLKLEVIDGI